MTAGILKLCRMIKTAMAIKRLAAAVRYSIAGLTATYQTEAAFRQEVWLSAVLVPLAFFLEVTAAARALLIFSVLIVPAAELLNTALETVTDITSPERQAAAKKVKDAASAAVFLLLLNAAAVWTVILWH